MHISLDSALGRQRRLNSVGESVFQIAPNAAAGYSLRSLTGGDPAVVRVRRESDNAERDFNASGVSSGELVNWVNQQITPPLDLRELTATGRDGPIIEAAAAYSLRNLSDSYTGNVVDVRRSSDDATRSFTAAEVADGTLTDWVNTTNDYVGYARFQDSTASNVILSSSFVLEASNSWSIKFGYIGGSLITGLFGRTNNTNTGFWFANQNSLGLTDNSNTYQALSFGNALSLKLGRHYEIEFFNTPSEGVRVKVNGTTMSTPPKTYGDITLNRIGVSRSRDGERVIENVRIDLNGDGTLDHSYAGDGNQASNWTDRVGSNNGTPTSQVLTYNNEYTSGFVSQWYDQSTTSGTPNANHAVQTDAASQPKIVDGGSYVNELRFDGVNDFMVSDVSTSGDDTTILVAKNNSTTGGSLFLDNQSASPKALYVTNSNFQAYYGAASDLNYGSLNNDYNLHFISTNATDSNNRYGSLNGTVDLLDSGTNNYTALSIGKSRLDTSPLNGSIKEIIIYDSDQTDNRTAFEANIGEVYGIAGIPAYDNTVNGFVETWYDQSGNGNDATQLTAGSQPKIVDAGVLVTGGIDFDGVDDHFDFSSGNPITSIDAASAFFVGSSDSSSNQCGINISQSASQRFYLPAMNSDSFRFGYADSLTAVTFASSNTSEHLFTGIAGASTTSGYYDGELKGTVSSATGVSGSGEIGSIGSVYRWDGRMREIIIYDSDQSANREAIEANINNQYDIY